MVFVYEARAIEVQMRIALWLTKVKRQGEGERSGYPFCKEFCVPRRVGFTIGNLRGSLLHCLCWGTAIYAVMLFMRHGGPARILAVSQFATLRIW